MAQSLKLQIKFIARAAILYCLLSVAFSILGLILPERTLQVEQLNSLDVNEVLGHIVWGLTAGAASLSVPYFLLGGALAILLDSDHLVGLFHLEVISKMSHSISFGIISIVIMMLILGKRNYLLGAIVASSLITHLSYDTFIDDKKGFPIFTPFYNYPINFQHPDWVLLEIAAVAIVGFVAVLKKKNVLAKFKNPKW